VFRFDREAIFSHPRLHLFPDLLPLHDYLDDLERYINEIFVKQGELVVQRGRVVALRSTDRGRLVSAFKAGLYLGKYQDLDNRSRFLKRMVVAEHSYEPIRGETVLFLFVGVGKPVYDHLITYSIGRVTRIAAGQRANLPWGYEVPVEARDRERYVRENVPRLRQLLLEALDGASQEPMQAIRSAYPVGYVMPPFLLEFSEEALIKSVFRQRLFEPGAQGATAEIVQDMLDSVFALDREKWEVLVDYHGPHIPRWRRAMRRLRDEKLTAEEVFRRYGFPVDEADEWVRIPKGVSLYDVLLETVGKLPPTFWEKHQGEDGRLKGK